MSRIRHSKTTQEIRNTTNREKKYIYRGRREVEAGTKKQNKTHTHTHTRTQTHTVIDTPSTADKTSCFECYYI
jgi:hypothetical protein